MTSMFTNHYRCVCGTEWEDTWDCACNDRCPSCNKEIEPHHSDGGPDSDEVNSEEDQFAEAAHEDWLEANDVQRQSDWMERMYP
jgi:hypothetical protein